MFPLSALCGLVISFVIQLNKKLSAVCFHLSFSDTAMVSVERVLSYTKLEPEIGYSRETFPAKLWPEYGAVTLKNLSLAYYPNGPQVLKDLSCSSTSSEKVNNVVLFYCFGCNDLIISGMNSWFVLLSSCSILGKGTLLSQCFSPHRNINGMHWYQRISKAT